MKDEDPASIPSTWLESQDDPAALLLQHDRAVQATEGDKAPTVPARGVRVMLVDDNVDAVERWPWCWRPTVTR